MTVANTRKPLTRGLATRLGLGSLARRLWHEPRSWFRNMVQEGGPYEQWLTAQGYTQMQKAARLLPTMPEPTALAYPTAVRFLSGARFWHQTLFCLLSLQLRTDRRVDAIIFDDGTLDDYACDAVLRVLPWTQFVMAETIEARLEERLPASRFPTLRSRRSVYPHLRKLTDLHDSDAWSLVFDSDMLFFRRPDAVLSWMDTPSGAIFIEDFMRSYGYSDSLMLDLARGPIPDRINVGLYGIHGSCVDYEYLEYCCRTMMEQERANYFQEQALTALVVSGHPHLALSRDDYRVLPGIAEGRQPKAALHHYVAHSKRAYFQYGWRLVFASALSRTPTSHSI